MIDPHLHIWHWQIPFIFSWEEWQQEYFAIAALYYIRGREKDYRTAVRITPFLAPVLLVLGLLHSSLICGINCFSGSFTPISKLQSPMSWGAWTLMVITPVSFIWCALHIRDIFPEWDWKYKWLNDLEEFFNKYKKVLAWVMLIYAIILGIYTGILLSAFNARPLWNTSILGPLFLASGLICRSCCNT